MTKTRVAKDASETSNGFSNPSTPGTDSPKSVLSKSNSQIDRAGPQNLDYNHEKLVKSLIKSFKRLEMALGKFDSKPAGVTKTNILRTVMLPFLRSSPPLHSFFEKGTKLYQSFASISTTVLGLWWRSLLACLNATGSSQVSTSDRSAYLECVSRIMALEEWHNADAQAASTFTACLCDTLDHSIVRLLSSKVVPISISAFVGKVFAYSFFYLPGVCSALLFLLNVKQKSLDRSSLGLSSVTLASKENAKAMFPPHVAHMIDYKGLEKLDREKRAAINCVIPPKHPVRGIRDPSGPWVRRWCSTDSDVFNSFFRHYINVADSIVGESSLVPPESFPGIRVVTSYISQIISVSVNRISLTKTAGHGANPTKPSNASNSQDSSKPTKESTNGSGLPPSSIPFKQIDCNYTSILKMFRNIRDISYSSIPFANQITTIMDSLLAGAARQIGLYDVIRTSLLLNLVYEFSIHVFDAADIDWAFWLHCNYLMLTSTYHVQIVTKNFAFLFNVWDRVPNLLDCRESARQYCWMKDPHESPKTNFSNWLTSSSIWQTYFMHWNPLVRSHYHRFLAWRLVGVNNYETPYSIRTTRRIKRNTNLTFESLCEALASDEHKEDLENLDFSSDSPIVNRKFGIVPINGKFSYSDEVSSLVSVASKYKSSDLRKSHPYEILDEAIYTCTSLHNSPGLSHSASSESISQQKFAESHSIMDSLSRFFKILSTDEPAEKEGMMAPPKKISGRIETGSPLRARTLSKSMLSLSAALSMKSVPSNQSCASSQMSPESINDQSTESSVTSDSDSSFSDRGGSSSISTLSSHSSPNLQPPELVKIPPDIVRPVFKLEIIIDHELNASKYERMQDHKRLPKGNLFFGSQAKHDLSYQTLPKPPKTPSVSVFLNSDAFHKFYITKETYSLGEDVMTKDEVDEFNSFKRDLRYKFCQKTDMTVLGKALNEWNLMVDEFENYLFEKVEADQTNYPPIASIDDEIGIAPPNLITEADYFTRIIPLFPIDNFTEMKLLNAS